MSSENAALVIVDVQSFYEQGFEHLTSKYIEKIENSTVPVIYYYVGELVNETKGDVIMFLLKNGLSEDICDKIRFVEKDYGFYRPFMDQNISSETIVHIVKKMQQDGYQDLRDILDNGYSGILDWYPSLSQKTNSSEITKLDVLFSSGETIFLPGLNDRVFKSFPENSKLELIGGGRWECLEEINIHLKSQNFITSIDESLSYGAESIDLKKKKNRKT